MTDVLDRSTEATVELVTERWEVQTSVPVEVTGNFDGMLMCHAEQAEGDFPIGIADSDGLLAQLRDYARDAMGVSRVGSAVLFRDGVPLSGYIDNRGIEGLTASQALRSLLAGFIIESTGIERMAQRANVEELIEQFPIPTFGSPPSGWEQLGQIAGSGSLAVFAGYAASIEQPMLACIGGGSAFVIWFLKPTARLVRRTFTERVGRWMGAEVRPEDLT